MERFLDMHMYITSALQKSDMKAVGLQLALDLLHQKVWIEYLKAKYTLFISLKWNRQLADLIFTGKERSHNRIKNEN